MPVITPVSMSAPRDIWEFYRLLGSIEDRLDAAGNGQWATRLRDAVQGGSTSGEILGLPSAPSSTRTSSRPSTNTSS